MTTENETKAAPEQAAEERVVDAAKKLADVKKEKPIDEMTDEELLEKSKEDDMKFMELYKDVKMEDLIGYGFVMHSVKISDTVDAKIRTLKSKEDKELGKKLGEYNGSNAYVLAENGSDVCSLCLMSFGQTQFKDADAAMEFIEDQSIAIKTLVLTEFNRLNKALAILLRGPGLENPLVAPLVGTGPASN